MPATTLVLGDLGTNVLGEVRVGADWGPFIVYLVDDNDTPIDLTGCTFGGEIKKTYKDSAIIAPIPITITDEAGGVFTFGLPRATTKTLKFVETVKDAAPYVWYLWMRDSTGREFPIYYGSFIVVWGSLAA